MEKKKKNKAWEKKKRRKIIDQSMALKNDRVNDKYGEEELISHLQEKLGKSKKEIRGLLKKL